MKLFPEKEEPTTPSREEEIRRMVGSDGSLSQAISEAPDNTGIAIPSTSAPSRGRKRRNQQEPAAQTKPELQVKTAAEIAAEEKRLAAVKKIQGEMAKDVAGIPYEVWAFIAQDDAKALKPDEEKELADAYALVAETLPLGNFSPMWTGIMFILSRNAKFIRARMPKDSPEMEEIKKALKRNPEAKL
jgi:hypothetical protein